MTTTPCTRRLLLRLSRVRADAECVTRAEQQLSAWTGSHPSTQAASRASVQDASTDAYQETLSTQPATPSSDPGRVPSAPHTHSMLPSPLSAHSPAHGILAMSWGPHSPMLHSVRGAKTKVEVEYHRMKEPRHDTYTTEPTNYIQLIGSVKYAGDLKRLKHIIQTYGGAFDTVHLSEALARVPKLAKYRDSDLVRGVIMNVPDLSSMPEVKGLPLPPRIPRSGVKPRSGYLADAAPVALQLMAILVGQANVKFVEPLSDDHHHKRVASKGSLWKLKTGKGLTEGQKTGSRAGGGGPLGENMSPREVATVVWALGSLHSMGVHLERGLTRASVQLMVNTLAEGGSYRRFRSDGSPIDVAMLLKGLAQLRSMWSTPRAVLDVLGGWTIRNIERFSAHDVQMTIRSLVALGYTEADVMHSLVQRGVTKSRDLIPAQISGVVQALAIATQKDAGAAIPADALQALTAGVAPQVVIMSGDNMAGLATALAHLGRTHITDNQTMVSTAPHAPTQQHHHGYGPVGNPGGLPTWLHSLVCLLGDKALRDLPTLTPQQLAAVLHMLAVLKVPHAPLLHQVVDGVLREQRIDPALSPTAAAALIRAVSALLPLLPSGALDTMDTGPCLPTNAPPPSPVQVHLAARETGLGLGNLPAAPGTPDEPLPAPRPLVSGPDALADALSRTRQDYQALVVEGAGVRFADRALSAVWRVLAVLAGPGGLDRTTLPELAALTDALAASKMEGAGKLVDEVLLRAEVLVQNKAEALLGKVEGMGSVKGGEADMDTGSTQSPLPLTQLSQLMATTATLGHTSAHLAGAAADYLQRALSTTSTSNRHAAVELLAQGVDLLHQCRMHGAEPAAAAKAAARVYTGLVTGTSGAGGGVGVVGWPEHTASGLAPTPPRSGKTATRPVLNGTGLAALLKACAATGVLDDGLIAAVSVHVTQLSAEGGSKADDGVDWVVECVTPLVEYAEQVDKQGKVVSGQLVEAVRLLVKRGMVAGEERSGELRALEGRLTRLKGVH